MKLWQSCAALIFTAQIVLHGSVPVSASPQNRFGLSNDSFDGRFGTVCSNRVRTSKNNFCLVSFYRLIANPEQHNNKFIGITGFLITVFGKPVIFPSRDSYESNAPGEGIFIFGSIPPDLKKQMADGINSVFVVGKFDAKTMGVGIYALGAIRNVENIAIMSHLPNR